MWISSCHRKLLPNSAASGCTSTTLPALSRKPEGCCIHALTEITMSEPVKPAIATGIPLAKCALGERRSHP